MSKEFIEYKNQFHFLLKQWPNLLSLIILAPLAGLLEALMLVLLIPLLHINNSGTLLPMGFNVLVPALSKISLVHRVCIIAVGLVVVSLLKNICIYAGARINVHLQLAVTTHFRQKAMDMLMRMGLGFFQQQRLSDFQLKVDSYIDAIGYYIVAVFGKALMQLGVIGILLVLLVHISWQLTCFSCLAAIAVYFLLNKIHRHNLSALQKMFETRKQLNHGLAEIIQGMKTIRSFDRQQDMKERFKKQIKEYSTALIAMNDFSEMITPLSESMGIFILAGVLMVGVLLVPKDSSSELGILMAFAIIVFRLIMPFRALISAQATIKEKWPMVQAIVDLLKTEDKEILQEGVKACPLFTKTICCEKVWFRYQEDHDWVLSDVSLTVKAGSHIALVGPSGSGKSTLVDLIMRFYDPTKGKILVDDMCLKDIQAGSWRVQVGIVSQDIFLFNDTVMNNLLLADPKASPEQVMQAACLAAADEFISQLPQGYNTLIGERGVLLSGGQRQRLAIARAFLAKARIIIFDEATASLDAVTEQEVLKSIHAVDTSVTMITIAHRLATVKNTDWIYVFDKGRIVQEGPHVELVQQEGLYRKLIELQHLTH